jgi:hypothetical protein
MEGSNSNRGDGRDDQVSQCVQDLEDPSQRPREVIHRVAYNLYRPCDSSRRLRADCVSLQSCMQGGGSRPHGDQGGGLAESSNEQAEQVGGGASALALLGLYV